MPIDSIGLQRIAIDRLILAYISVTLSDSDERFEGRDPPNLEVFWEGNP